LCYNFIIAGQKRGALEIEIDFKPFKLSEGNVIFCSPGRLLKTTINENVDGYYILFTDKYLYEFLGDYSQRIIDMYTETYSNPKLPGIKSAHSIMYKQAEMLFSIYRQDDSRFSFEVLTLSFQTIIEMLLFNLSSETEKSVKYNKKFITFSKLVDEHLHEIKSVDTYANMLHVTKKTINQLTRNAVNLSAKQYIVKKTIQRMKIYLCRDDISIAEIALELGFTEPNNFSKFFKKYEGCTASEFRKQMLG